MRCGAGLVTLGIPAGLNTAVIRIKPREVMTYPLPETKEGALSYGGLKKIRDFIKNDADVVVIGPGLGSQDSSRRLARELIAGCAQPMVIDADGLNALAGHLDVLKRVSVGCQVVLTPHPGEMARLLGTDTGMVQRKRKTLAIKFASDYNVCLVLKGHNTIVVDRENFYVNRTGNPGMATAGSGDVLSGMIAAFLGQGLGSFEAAKYAVYLHGLAGDIAAGEKSQISLIASDIIDKIPQAVKQSS
jgi:hydroxyethylthiazole kinase-like uncharacterized protein yjeF